MEKDLNELINGRTTDKIYIPNDTNAVFQLSKMVGINGKIPAVPGEVDEYEKQIDELKKKIKASSACIELCSLKTSELKEILEQTRESDDAAFEKSAATLRFLKSIVSLTEPEQPTIYRWDKDDSFWIDYLKAINENQSQSYVRIVHKMDELMITAETEASVMENLDFL